MFWQEDAQHKYLLCKEVTTFHVPNVLVHKKVSGYYLQDPEHGKWAK